MKVYQQMTTGKVHRRKNCGMSARTRYWHVEREMTSAELDAADKCGKCWIGGQS